MPNMQKDTALFALATENVERPEQPEILQLLRRAKNLDVPLFNGSFYDWPHITLMEVETCYRAEGDYKDLKLRNIQAAAHYANQS